MIRGSGSTRDLGRWANRRFLEAGIETAEHFVAVSLARRLTAEAVGAIGRCFGGVSSAGIFRAVQRVEARREAGLSWDRQLAELTAELANPHLPAGANQVTGQNLTPSQMLAFSAHHQPPAIGPEDSRRHGAAWLLGPRSGTLRTGRRSLDVPANHAPHSLDRRTVMPYTRRSAVSTRRVSCS